MRAAYIAKASGLGICWHLLLNSSRHLHTLRSSHLDRHWQVYQLRLPSSICTLRSISSRFHGHVYVSLPSLFLSSSFILLASFAGWTLLTSLCYTLQVSPSVYRDTWHICALCLWLFSVLLPRDDAQPRALRSPNSSFTHDSLQAFPTSSNDLQLSISLTFSFFLRSSHPSCVLHCLSSLKWHCFCHECVH